jgi:lipopolysaccharide export system protein LptC
MSLIEPTTPPPGSTLISTVVDAGHAPRWQMEQDGSRPPPVRYARGRLVRVVKYVLPVLALALLSSIALWPEISRTIERGRVTWHRLTSIDPSSGMMKKPRYRGYDGQNQPYTVVADTAQRVSPERFNLRMPRGDLTMKNGTWLQVRGKRGTYFQHPGLLDLYQDVMLYRQDGTIMTSSTATVDMHGGAVTSDQYTHAEGPFGQLDAQGFTLLDKGNIVQFHGPAKLVLNGGN